jgi:tetratricopeptide (TPR) repeat protein
MSTLTNPTSQPVSIPAVIANAAAGSVQVDGWRRYLRASWLRCLLLLLIGVIVRSPALQGQRIWDDKYLSQANPFIKSPILILETFRHYLFVDSLSPHYRPIQNISFIFDYYFWNTDEFGFHLTNVLLHAASGIALFFLLRQVLSSLLFRRTNPATRNRAFSSAPWISNAAFCIALLWLVHPVHSAAVDYISGRADSLAFFFSAAGWLIFLRAQRIPRFAMRVAFYCLSAISGLVALLSREIACIWVLLFVAHTLFVEKQLPLRFRVFAAIGALGLVAIYAGFRELPDHRSTLLSQPASFGPDRVVLMLRALGDYSRLMLFPANLHMERTVFDPRSLQTNATWREKIGDEYLSILGLIAFAVFVFGSVKSGRAQPIRTFGASWFLAGYLPISNIVQLNATVAEHWLYLPSVGFLIFVFGVALELPTRSRRFIAAAAIIAVISLATRSFVRSGDWVNEETFYKRTFEAGGKSGRVAVNLGQIYSSRGQYSEAEPIFRDILKYNPDYPFAQNDLAEVFYRQGKIKEAEELFAQIEKKSAQTRRDYPRTWIGALNLAVIKHNRGKDEEALALLAKARKDYPEVWELVRFEAEILRENKKPDAALQLVENFARDNWWHHGAALALGQLYAQMNDANRAEAALRHASWLDIHDSESLRLIALMRLRENRLAEAVTAQRRAIARQPDEPRQYLLLSNILEKMGRNDEARATLAAVSHMRALAQVPTAAN